MQKLRFIKDINAPAWCVYETMLGLNDKSTYEYWARTFHPTSTFEGGWKKGDKILFDGIDENGKKSGMVCEVADNIPGRFVSIRPYGLLDGEVEITSGALAGSWTGGRENYSFAGQNGTPTLTVEIDVPDDYVEYFNETLSESAR